MENGHLTRERIAALGAGSVSTDLESLHIKTCRGCNQALRQKMGDSFSILDDVLPLFLNEPAEGLTDPTRKPN